MSSHYFDSTPAGPERQSQVRASIWGQDYSFTTASGVFSAERLDKATAILLDECAPPAPGLTVLDLGCGWGPIACALAAAGCTTWAVDINERALSLTAKNADALGLTVQAVAPQDVPTDLRFDEIWSNPPIRIGKEALHELLLTWLPRLTPEGTARLVVGKNLGADSLARWLMEQGYEVERQASAKGFRILLVRHGR